jgi:hypothetical protein
MQQMMMNNLGQQGMDGQGQLMGGPGMNAQYQNFNQGMLGSNPQQLMQHQVVAQSSTKQFCCPTSISSTPTTNSNQPSNATNDDEQPWSTRYGWARSIDGWTWNECAISKFQPRNVRIQSTTTYATSSSSAKQHKTILLPNKH